MMSIIIVSILGVFLALSSYPIDLFFLNFISLGGLLYFIEKTSSKKKHFLYGYLFGFFYFLTSLYWIPVSMMDFLGSMKFLVIPTAFITPLILSIFTGFMTFAAGFFRINRIYLALAFSSLWVLTEYIRSTLILPFPWNLLGYSTTSITSLLQIASIIGVYGLSFVTTLISTSLYTRSITYISIITLLFLSTCIYGYQRLKNSNNLLVNNGEKKVVRIIQPNITDISFQNQSTQEKALNKLINLTVDNKKNSDYIIWPEASLPIPFINNNKYITNMLSGIIRNDSKLLIGADRIINSNKNDLYEQYNSLIVINEHGIVSIYDKQILVPFGEYIPFKKVFPFINKIARSFGVGDFNFGKNTSNSIKIDMDNNIIASICSESIFDMSYFNIGTKNNLFLLNITNDMWFGNTLGPYQHFNMSRMRAVEYGIPMIIAANTGISGVIDSFGRVIQKTQINKEAIIEHQIPKKLITPTLFYKTNKYIIPFIAMKLLIIIFMYKFFILNKRKK